VKLSDMVCGCTELLLRRPRSLFCTGTGYCFAGGFFSTLLSILVELNDIENSKVNRNLEFGCWYRMSCGWHPTISIDVGWSRQCHIYTFNIGDITHLRIKWQWRAWLYAPYGLPSSALVLDICPIPGHMLP